MKSHPNGIQFRAFGGAVEPCDRLALGDRVAAFLRSRHPTKTADNAAAETGIPLNTIKTWLRRGSAPDAEGYTALWIAYGPDFLDGMAGGRSPQWLVKLRRDEDATRLKAEIAALEHKLSKVQP